METDIRYPGDSHLLNDGVRVLSRVIGRAKHVVAESVHVKGDLFRDRTRSAKRLARQVAEAARRRGEAGEAARRATYGRLLVVAEASLGQARIVREGLASSGDKLATRLIREVDYFVPLVEQVVCQTKRGVLAGEAVPAGEKMVSLFEPHTCIIRRGKADKPTEFGRKVWLDEVDGGIISNYRVPEGNPPDGGQLGASLAEPRRLFGMAPDTLAGDRGVHSAENELMAQQMGVKRVGLPKPGHKDPERTEYKRQGWFRRAQRFRAGVEGRISVLKRHGYLGRCRDHGEDGFGRWVGWGLITANLATIARKVAA